MIKQLFRFRSEGEFRARSRERDADTDSDTIKYIVSAIEAALNKAENERIGLKARIDDVLSRAAIVGGNDIDDYLTRTEDRSRMLGDSDAETRRGEERLKVLDQNIAHVKFLKTALRTRFPDLNIWMAGAHGADQGWRMTAWIYINTAKEVGDVDHLKVVASEEAAEHWFAEHDPEGVAFEYEVEGWSIPLLRAVELLRRLLEKPETYLQV
jgi:hypothetical protein